MSVWSRNPTPEYIFNSPQANATTLNFPSEQDLERKERVPRAAMDLINNLLQEREHRLCSKQYSINDFHHRADPDPYHRAAHAEKPPQDYQGHYVYPDDAVDIKAHPFFHGISWETIHLSRPPFIPDVRSQGDTKYFDDDEISDVDDGSSQQDPLDSTTSFSDSRVELLYSQLAQYRGEEGTTTTHNKPTAQRAGNGPCVAGNKAAKRREKRRPRDRVLRDKEVGKKVLELRKKGAFLGYAYQRPANMVYEEDRGRQSIGLRPSNLRRRLTEDSSFWGVP